MNRRCVSRIGLSAVGLGLAILAGCDYSPPIPQGPTGGTYKPGFVPIAKGSASPGLTAKSSPSKLRAAEERKAILDSSMTLIKGAALLPGGSHYGQAVQKLNQYFEGTDPSEYQIDSTAREYLKTQLPPNMLKDIESTTWTLRDARHLEDCMMYYGIANRIAGTGEDIDRVRRVFQWVVEQVQLVPAGRLGAGRLGQAFARPYDVLLRGMATEAEGVWAERAWLFMALCRQLGIDSGLLTYTKGNVVEPAMAKYGSSMDRTAPAPDVRKTQKAPIIWICAVLIGDRAYLFDARLGLEIPGPGGSGVATVADALSDPEILDRMDLPGEAPYFTSRASLLASPSKIGVMIDSSSGYFSPKMKMLQRELAGKNRTILYRDPSEQGDHFARILAPHNGKVSLWGLPLEVETRLFNDPQFVQSIQNSLFFFKPEFPLIYARVKQLRGEVDEAIEDYGKFRFAENVPFVNDKDKKRLISKEIQAGLDVYATYYLALAQLEKKDLKLADLMFRRTLEILPPPAANQPFYNAFRWGANANLGRIAEARKNDREAIGYYTQIDPTAQYVGNLIRARELVWRDPIAPLAPTTGAKDSTPKVESTQGVIESANVTAKPR